MLADLERLIARLARQAEPVRVLPPPRVLLRRWAVVALLSVVVGLAWFGVRGDAAARVGSPDFLAQALDRIMGSRPPLIIVDIQVPDADLVKRLTSRLVCSQCGTNAPEGLLAGTPEAANGRCEKCGGTFTQRADDTEEVVLERLKVYQRNTKPLVDYYQPRPTFCPIDGRQAPAQVAELIGAAVDAAAGVLNVNGGLSR